MSEKGKARRTVPRKQLKPPTERQVRTNRARRREILEQQERDRRRLNYPEPESDACYKP